MSQKSKIIKYEVGKIVLTQDELSLKDGKAVLKLLKDLDWTEIMSGEIPTTELMDKYMETGLVEELIAICVKGIPEGTEVEDFLSMENALTMVNDFFELNVSLIKSATILLASLIRSKMPEDQGSEKNDKSPQPSTELKQPPSTQEDGSVSTSKSNSPSPKEGLTE
ncbi:hypothetical protein HQ531_03600 [bacterium]|nr:hypothetical protein [bacterium]